jgi:hypothetical protein
MDDLTNVFESMETWDNMEKRTMDDLINVFDSMNTLEQEELNYRELVNSIESAKVLFETINPSCEDIMNYIELASNRYINMMKIMTLDEYIECKLEEFFSDNEFTLRKVSVSYDIDNAIHDYLE